MEGERNLKLWKRFVELPPEYIGFKLARHGLSNPPNPITLTFSVTNRCQSRCRTCKIWRYYREHPEKESDELSLDEIERIFASTGHVGFLNISGGEPFLREDISEIVALGAQHLTPEIIHLPTNALQPEKVVADVKKMLEGLRARNYEVPLTVKPSLDGVGALHDEIRGVRGNFDKVTRTVEMLKELCADYANLHVEVGTVVSKDNIDRLDELAEFVKTLGVESYRSEIAEERAEFFNRGDGITPDLESYERAIASFANATRERMRTKRRLTRAAESLRLVYYDLAVRIMREKRQVLPCYGGITNAHLNPYGELWPCCVLGYDKPLGTLRENDYDFQKVWHSQQAREVREYVRAGNCACPLANQTYSNILMSPRYLAKTVFNLLRAM